MTVSRLALAALAVTLAGCGGRGPGGPGGPGGREASPAQTESTATIACRIAPYAAADGTVTRTALDTGLRAEFAAADTNADGALQKSEIAALNAARASSCDSEPVIDWEGAGQMSYAIYAARLFTVFDRADTDQDGVINAEELSNVGRRKPDRRAPPSPDGRS